MGDAPTTDAYVLKLSRAGELLFSSWFGGSSMDVAYDIAIDPEGNAVIAGTTDSIDLPATANAYQRRRSGRDDLFLARIAADGSRVVACTYLGGPEIEQWPVQIALDRQGAVHIAFTLWAVSVKGPQTGHVVKLDAALSNRIWSRSLGGGLPEGITVDEAGRAAVVGSGANLAELCAQRPPGIGGFANSLFSDSRSTVWSKCTDGHVLDRLTNVAAMPGGEVAVSGLSYSRDNPPYGEGPFPAKYFMVLAETANRPVFLPSGIVHGATFQPGPIAPGSIVTIMGDGLASAAAAGDGAVTELAGVSVIIDGLAVGLFFVSPAQINALAPVSIRPGSTVRVRVRSGGIESDTRQVRVAEFAPGIFMTPTGPAVQRAFDWELVSPATPIAPGEHFVIWATGLGLLDAAGLTVTKPVVLVGGSPAEVTWAGAAPGLPGLYQVNAIVPQRAYEATPVLQLRTGNINGNGVPLFLR
jgi:uncharacterized protein (TIGR03437 family)